MQEASLEFRQLKEFYDDMGIAQSLTVKEIPNMPSDKLDSCLLVMIRRKVRFPCNVARALCIKRCIHTLYMLTPTRATPHM